MKAPKQIKRTLVIGLGGTGATTILYLKKTFLELFGKIPAAIEFISLDTEKAVSERSLNLPLSNQKVQLRDDEFLHLEVQDTLQAISVSKWVKEWWPEGLPALSARNGSGAIRALGRLAFYVHSREIFQILNKKLRRLDDLVLDKDLEAQGFQLLSDKNVYIVGSLAGGTGSGALLDAAFLTSHAVGNVASRCAFLVLPWVFDELPATPRIRANAYAALKELEYFMGLKYDRATVVRKYGTDEVKVTRPPFDMINLIDARNELGRNLSELGSSGVRLLCEHIAKAIVATCGPMGKVGDAITDNIRTIIASETEANWGGKFPWYSSIGLSTVVYPAEKHFRRMACSFALRLIDDGIAKYKGVKDAATTQTLDQAALADVEIFLIEAKLREETDDIINRIVPYESCSTDFHTPADLKKKKNIDKELRSLTEIRREQLAMDLKASLDKNLAPTKTDAVADLKNKLQGVTSERGVDVGIRFAKAFRSRIAGYKDSLRIPEIDAHRLAVQASRADQEDALRNMPTAFKIIQVWSGKAVELIGKYEKLVQDELNEQFEATRKENALKVYDALLEAADEFLKPFKSVQKAVEKLESIKDSLQSQLSGMQSVYFRSEQKYNVEVPSFSGKMYVKRTGGNEVEIGNVGSLNEILRLRSIETRFERFMADSGLTDAALTTISDKDLWATIGEYAEGKMAFIKQTTVEEVLIEGQKRDQEYIGKKITDASNLANPWWYHKARGNDYAMRMKNLFIIGVDNENTILMKPQSGGGTSLLPSSTKTPDFAFLNDPHRIYVYEYSVPLPSYLLVDMDRYKIEYQECPVKMTPHTDKDMHFIADDLFPTDPEARISMKLFALSYACNVVLVETETTGRKKISMDSVPLGRSFYEALETFNRPEQLELRKSVRNDIEGKKWARDSSELASSLQNLQRLSRDPEIPLGEAIVLDKMRGMLAEFEQAVRKGATAKQYLDATT